MKLDRGFAGKFYTLSIAAIFLLALAYIAAVWGHTGYFSGDFSLWHNHVERFAQAEIPYSDFDYPYPPLSIWVIGWAAKLLGTDLAPLAFITSALFLSIAILDFQFIKKFLPQSLIPLTLFSSLLLSVAYSNEKSVSLALGTYTPAVPLGFVFVLCTLIMCLDYFEKPHVATLVFIGLSSGLACLTKQDFWPAILFVLGFLLVMISKQKAFLRLKNAAILAASFVVTLLVGMWLIARNVGWKMAYDVMRGASSLVSNLGRALPSWEKITANLTAFAWAAVLFMVCLIVTKTISFHRARFYLIPVCLLALSATIIYIFMTITNQLSLAQAARFWFNRMQLHLFSYLIPVSFLLVLLFRWRKITDTKSRNLALFLLGVCLALKFRRAFEYIDWYQILIDVPVFTFAALLLIPEIRQKGYKAATLFLGALVVIGAHAYYDLGTGPLTKNHNLHRFETPRGTVYWTLKQIDEFKWLQDILGDLDPKAQRPIVVYAYPGAFHYYFDRKNPTPFRPLYFSYFEPPDGFIEKLFQSSYPPILVDNLSIDSFPVPTARIDLTRWEQETEPNEFYKKERPFFNRLIASCTKAQEPITAGRFVFYDCR